MAWADYKICDCCGDRKVFYDADIRDERYRATFGEKSDYDPIGLKAICGDCNKTHEVVIVSRGAADRIEALIAERDRYLRHLTAGAESIKKVEAERDAARDAALEEAGKMAESPDLPVFKRGWSTSQDAAAISTMMAIAAAIRALKGKSHE